MKVYVKRKVVTVADDTKDSAEEVTTSRVKTVTQALKKRGRPTLKTDTRVQVIQKVLEETANEKRAYETAGIAKQTYVNWKNEDDDFCVKVALWKSTKLRALQSEAEKQNPLKVLQSLEPEVFSENIRHELTGAGGEPLKVLICDYRDEEPKE